jgi:hypothetical protein
MKYWKSLCLAIVFTIGNSIVVSAQNNGIKNDSIFFKQIFDEATASPTNFITHGGTCL